MNQWRGNLIIQPLSDTIVKRLSYFKELPKEQRIGEKQIELEGIIDRFLVCSL